MCQWNVIEICQGYIGWYMDFCLCECIQVVQGYYVVGGEYGIGQCFGCQ